MGLQSIIEHVMRRPIRPVQATVTTEVTTGAVSETKERVVTSGWKFYLRFFMKDKPSFVGLIIIAVFLVWGALEGLMQELQALYPYGRLFGQPYGWALIPSNPFVLNFAPNYVLQPPSFAHFPNFLFGTNSDGQSILARLMYATPHDVEAPIIVVGSALLIGMFMGTAAGYFGGWVDEAIMRFTDAFLALPALILAIAVGVLLGGGFTSVLIALMIVWWPTYARFFRAQALTIRERGYVESSKLSGAGSFRVLIKHIIPNSVDPIIAYVTLDLGTVILFLAALAFIGVGVSLYPEWGSESNFGLDQFPTFWWWAIIPGVVIGVVVVGFTLIGDRLQDLISGRMTY
jgi:peptide/nickel transport system permease protein